MRLTRRLVQPTGSRMVLSLNRSLPLFVTLPLFVAVAIFVIAVATTQIGVWFLKANYETALRDQAAVFLDAVAGHVAGEIDDGPEAVRYKLAASLTFQTALLEEAMAARWNVADRAPQTIIMGDKHLPILMDALDGSADLRPATTKVETFPDMSIVLVVRSYTLPAGGSLLLSATFDATSVAEASDWASSVALGIDVLVAILAALAVYAVVRRLMAPLDRFITRLADQDSNGVSLSARGSELQQLETALALRENSEAGRLKLLEGMAQQERDALLARMAAGIAHEVRNPLAGLKNSVSTLKRFGERAEIRAQTLDILEKGLDSIGRVVDVALSTYRRRTGNTRIVASDIGDLALLIQPDAVRAGVALAWDLDHEIQVNADADALRQILINLLLNAIRASPAGGTVTVTFGPGETAGGACVTISDQGSGMPPEMVAAIVSRQIDDVPVERSLGIWMVAILVEQMGAHLSIRSEDAAGTTVRIELPPTKMETGDVPAAGRG